MNFLKNISAALNRRPKFRIEDLLELLFINSHSLKMIQVGANDGVLCDPLRKYIVSQKLSGIMLEPQKNVFEVLKSNHTKSKDLYFENVALGQEVGTSSLFKVHSDLVSQYKDLGGVASFDRKHVLQEILSNKKKLSLLQGRTAESYIEKEQVQVVTYESLISKYNLKSLDLLMIDAEGFDFEAVSLFPYELFLPKAIVFEYKHLHESQLNDLKLRLKNYGYISFFAKNDALFILESS